MRKLLLIACLLLITVNAFADATITASGATVEEVSTAIATASASSGVVTVVIPSGEETWSSNLNINMSTGFASVTSLIITGAGSHGTIITFNSAKIYITSAAGKKWRITNLKIKGAAPKYQAIIHSVGTTKPSASGGYRIDNIEFETTCYTTVSRPIYIDGAIYGVIDNCTGQTDGQFSTFEDVNSYGNESWNTGSALGSADSNYLENNTMAYVKTTNPEQAVMFADGAVGGRVVVRYNTLTNFYLGGHDASSNYRGILQYEVYNNYLIAGETQSGGVGLISHRGGTGVVFNNRLEHMHDTPYYPASGNTDSGVHFRNNRDTGCSGGVSAWGAADIKWCNPSSGLKLCLGSGATTWGGSSPYTCTTEEECGGTTGVTSYCLTIEGGGSSETYPQCRDQIGTGNNTYPQTSKPFLLWNNQSKRASADWKDSPLVISCGTPSSIVKDRDYCEHTTTMPASCNSVETTYTAYTCPNPLTGLAEGCTTDAYGTTGYNTGEDTTVPTCTFAIDSTGLIATGTCSESVDAVTKTGLSFTGSVTGAITATYKDGMPGANPRFDLGSEVQQSDVVTADYTTPGTGIKDAAGNALANFTGASVFNGSTQNTPPTYSVTINKTGAGCTITSSPSGANCGATCSVTVDNGTVVTLGGYLENGWASITYGGDCAANGTVTVNEAKTCTVTCTPIYLLN